MFTLRETKKENYTRSSWIFSFGNQSVYLESYCSRFELSGTPLGCLSENVRKTSEGPKVNRAPYRTAPRRTLSPGHSNITMYWEVTYECVFILRFLLNFKQILAARRK